MTTTPATESPASLGKLDTADFMSDLDAGRFERIVSAGLCLTAAGVHDWQKKGSVTLKFELEPIPGTQQVRVNHTLTYSRPLEHGKQGEEHTRSTPMYVGKGGKLTLAPENQLQMFDRKNSEPLVHGQKAAQ